MPASRKRIVVAVAAMAIGVITVSAVLTSNSGSGTRQFAVFDSLPNLSLSHGHANVAAEPFEVFKWPPVRSRDVAKSHQGFRVSYPQSVTSDAPSALITKQTEYQTEILRLAFDTAAATISRNGGTIVYKLPNPGMSYTINEADRAVEAIHGYSILYHCGDRQGWVSIDSLRSNQTHFDVALTVTEHPTSSPEVASVKRAFIVSHPDVSGGAS